MTYRYYTLDEEHKLVGTNNFFKWAKFMGDFDNRKVKHTKVKNFTVSTVFLGINLPGQKMFETMIFNKKGVFLDYQTRCNDYSEALEQNKDGVKYLKTYLKGIDK